MCEHMRHAGTENGNLIATYNQLVECGIARRYVHSSIIEAEERKLILVEYGARRGYTKSYHNTFTLTFLPEKITNDSGVVVFREASHIWRQIA